MYKVPGDDDDDDLLRRLLLITSFVRGGCEVVRACVVKIMTSVREDRDVRVRLYARESARAAVCAWWRCWRRRRRLSEIFWAFGVVDDGQLYSCDSCCIVSSRSGGVCGMYVVDEMNARGDGDGNWVLVSTDVHCLRTASQSAS